MQSGSRYGYTYFFGILFKKGESLKSIFVGDHKSKAVINVLLDLLYDEDQDVRVVSAISLAHAASEIRSIKTRSEVVNG